ncbi:MAG: hypothetical protein EXR78_01585 [Deltaproteobacteria bacterium]|nr:hypothetical protein [Deltaproteobacteria bacterium]
MWRRVDQWHRQWLKRAFHALALTGIIIILTAVMGDASQEETLMKHEQPAAEAPFVVTTSVGPQLRGTAARVEIKYLDVAQAPQVEIVFSAADAADRLWAAQALPPADFLKTPTLSAQVVDRPLTLGTASVQVSQAGGDAVFSPGGLLTLQLRDGRLVGETREMGDEFSARFEGPFVVTCAVPATTLTGDAPTPTSDNTLPILVVDERFESPLCQPFATLAGWR